MTPVAILNIGDELLIGQVVNTNASYMAEQLSLHGFDVTTILAVGDNSTAIYQALDFLLEHNQIILITGGLGPTNDDVTKKVLCQYFGRKLVQNQAVLENIRQIFEKRNYALTETNIKQAEVPENAIVFNNFIGTAPAFLLRSKNNSVVIAMPGVPFEMKQLMHDSILPYLKTHFPVINVMHKTILTQGIGESLLAEKIADWEKNLPANASLAYLPSPGIVRLRITLKNDTENNLQHTLHSLTTSLQNIIGDYIFGFDNDNLETIIGKLLLVKNKTLSVAESCTGGNIAHKITSISGSSQYFKGAIIAYDNEVKKNILGVNEEILIQHGAVSEPVVKAMAEGVRKLLNTDYAIATSGIAGPTGGTETKPVGTTWIAVATRDKVCANKYIFADNRERNIERATVFALQLLRKILL